MNFLSAFFRTRKVPRQIYNRAAVLGLMSGLASAFAAMTASNTDAADEAQAAQGPPFNIPIFVSSRADVCYDSGDIAAIKRMTALEQDKINSRGGVSGRPIKVTLFDDARDEKKTIENLRTALLEPTTLAMIGMPGSTRAKIAFEALSNEIKNSQIPFLSDISVNKIFAAFPTVYTTRASQDDDSIPVMAKFTRHLGFERPAFFGLRDVIGSVAIGDGLKSQLGDGGLVADLRVAATENKINTNDISAAVAEMKTKQPDLLYLIIGGDNVPAVMKELVDAKTTPALFIGGRIDTLPADITNSYPNAIYSLAWDNPPEVYNNRLKRLISPASAPSWIFEGQKIPAASGWADGKCKPHPETNVVDPFNSANMRAITVGSQYADMVGIIASTARTPDRSTDITRLRAQILKALSTTYQAGRGSFKSAFGNWSFVAHSRTAARDPFIIILPQGLGRTQLAPFQFVRSKDGTLRQMETLYVDVDLIKAYRVDENQKTFFAEFYLSMRDNDGASIDKIEFANAYLEAQSGGGRQILTEVIHPGGKSAAYPESMKIYKVSGRFLFDPELVNYPFDTQRFSIDIQPKSGETPFIIQPPPLDLRDKTVIADGWEPKGQYVGYDQNIVPIVDAYTHEPSVVPFYRTSFVWVMQRQTTDYLLRVAVPLGFILFVAYLSVFIPRHHFEAIVTIQVTALLSSVALYLSLPKLDSDTATLSDRGFVFAYMILSIIIGISILRVSPIVGASKGRERAYQMLHVAAIPALVAAAAYYGYQMSFATG